ncbi:TlpA disulfide reductase family protein [Pedobacter frigidisoli]|uniref:TlpA disulfide reductase family protein n=1 Tax=Pedobacter frigidisoli TaxID=2530455 RepID=UPI00292E34A0|nr:TlpA disulfide reductase family protein [Pedobacter frigidisoli]
MRRKINLILILFLSFVSKSFGQENKLSGTFVLELHLKNIPDAYKAIITYPQGGKRVSDSALIVNGKCAFQGTLSECARAGIGLVKKNPDKIKPHIFISQNVFECYLAPGKATLVADSALKNGVYQGSSGYISEYEAYVRDISSFRRKNVLGIFKEQTPNLTKDERSAYIKQKNKQMFAKMKEQCYKGFMLSHLHSPVGLFAFQEYAGFVMTDSLENLFRKLDPSIQKLPTGLYYEKLFNAIHRIRPGVIAPDFTIPDTAGHNVSVSTFKGKYVLLDFWASWCSPCRKEHPNLVAAYQRFKSKGFTVFSVSVDKMTTRPAWLKAIREDKLDWTNASDLMGWDSVPSKLYGISVVPQNFLIDPAGKVLAINLHGPALQQKLEELFKIP